MYVAGFGGVDGGACGEDRVVIMGASGAVIKVVCAAGC